MVLGVSGGIAAYKSIELARDLTLPGALVDVMLTRSALEFVRPLPFQTLTRRKVFTEVFEPWTDEVHGHITMAERADVMLIAPATADIIAKLAHGWPTTCSQSALSHASPRSSSRRPWTTTCICTPPRRRIFECLRQRGVRIVGPERGLLASGAIGFGRLVPVERLIDAVRLPSRPNGRLRGRRVVVSAGPTREKIDPIRLCQNRSSGKMGYAIAEAFLDEGALVTLVRVPPLSPAERSHHVPIESAEEMYLAVKRQCAAPTCW